MPATSSGKSGLATLFGLRGADPNSLEVPPAPYVDTTVAQQQATLGNLRNLPALSRLGAQTNAELLRQSEDALAKIIPGYRDIISKGSAAIQSELSGQLPADVESYIQRKAAEMGVSSGTSGSEFNKFGALRNLGLTSLDVTNKALDSASRWINAAASRTPQFNFASMFVTPAQRIATDQWNEVNRYNAQFLRNQIKMLPSNAEMAGAQVLDYVADYATMAASIYGGGAMGGGGAGAAGGAGASVSAGGANTAASGAMSALYG